MEGKSSKLIKKYLILIILCYSTLILACGGGGGRASSGDITGSNNSEKQITAYSFTSAANPVLPSDIIGTIIGSNISIILPYGTDVSSLIASFTTTGQSIAIGNTIQVNGANANDFTNPVTYIVTAADSSTKDYTVTVTVALSSAKEITDFRFLSVNNPSLTQDIVANIIGSSITVTLPYGTNPNGLIANFNTTGQSVKAAGSAQTSGISANDFTNPVTYTVTAADNSTKDYTVTIIIALNPAKDITDFRFLS